MKECRILFTFTIFIFLSIISSCGGGGGDVEETAEELIDEEVVETAPEITANDDYVYTRVNTQINIDTLANDTRIASTDIVEITSLPTNGIVNIELDDSITYIPNADYIGLDSFSYSLSSSTSNDIAVVQIGVTAIPERVNVRSTGLVSAGLEANKDTDFPSIDLSADGRYVVFHSEASNLVDGDTNDWSDAFVHDRDTGETKIVSSNGANAFPGLSITDDGSLVFYHDQGWEINVVDTSTLAVEKYFGVNGGNGVTASGDGRYFAFHSDQPHFLEDTNTKYDIYLHDRQDDVTVITSKPGTGEQALGNSVWPAMSTDGTKVAYFSEANNLVDGDNNPESDVFVTNIVTGEISLISIKPDGSHFSGGVINGPSISENGRYVAFTQWPDATYLRDTQANTTVEICSSCFNSDISSDGRFIVFTVYHYMPINGDTNDFADIVVYDSQTKQSMLVVIGMNGEMPDSNSGKAAISEDGKSIAFSSYSSNLVISDTNSANDIFVVSNPLFR